MKSKIIYLIISLSLFYISSILPAEPTQAKFEPSEGKILLIVGQDSLTIEKYLEEVKIIPGGFMVYTSITSMDGLDYISNDYGSGTSHADELIKKYPNTVIQIGLYMVNSLEDTYLGCYDCNIDKLAAWAKKVKVPIYLRIGYEFDGPHNHYDPDEYKKAYCYLVDKLRSAKVDNIAYVWHVHAHSIRSLLDNWYPGDEYVDWVGISYFRQHENYMKPAIQFAKKHHKPVMIAEGTPQAMGTNYGEKSWKRWFKPLFEFVDTYDIKAISYINSYWDQMPMWENYGWGDARIEADPYVKGCWLKKIQKDKYLKSSDDLFKQLGYTP